MLCARAGKWGEQPSGTTRQPASNLIPPRSCFQVLVNLSAAVTLCSANACAVPGTAEVPALDSRSLELIESRTEPLTPPAAIAGAALSPHGAIFAWFSNRPDAIWIASDGRRKVIGRSVLHSPVAARFVPGDSIVELVLSSSKC